MSIFGTAPIGSLLKGMKPERQKPEKKATRKPPKKDMGRGQRVRLPEHLDAIRQCQCLACSTEGRTEAAHLQRKVGPGTGAGIGMKADDCYVVPLCTACHTTQHSVGETTFFKNIGVDPFLAAKSFIAVSPNVEAMRASVSLFLASSSIKAAEKKQS